MAVIDTKLVPMLIEKLQTELDEIKVSGKYFCYILIDFDRPPLISARPAVTFPAEERHRPSTSTTFYSTVSLVPPISIMDVYRGIT